jgi:hypothetical protein
VIGVCNLPTDKQNDRCEKQAPSKEILYKEQRGVHHKVTPVENSAVYTATIFHDKRLKRTPQNHANEISHIKEHRQQNQFFCADYLKQIEQCHDTI